MLSYVKYKNARADNAVKQRPIPTIPRTPASMAALYKSIVAASNFVDKLAGYCDVTEDAGGYEYYLQQWTLLYNAMVVSYTDTTCSQVMSVVVTNKPCVTPVYASAIEQ